MSNVIEHWFFFSPWSDHSPVTYFLALVQLLSSLQRKSGNLYVSVSHTRAALHSDPACSLPTRPPEDRMLSAPRRLLPLLSARCQPRLTMSSRANSRLSQISKHLDAKPFFILNTPFSTERTARLENENGDIIVPKKSQEPKKETATASSPAPKPEINKSEPAVAKNMSQQAAHPALLIPGPIEFDDAVLNSMSHHRYGVMLRRQCIRD